MKIFLAVLLALAIANANAQTKPVSLAWQVTHVDQASPSISPDGKRIVYAVLISGKEQIFTMNLDGSNPVQITHDDINHNNPVWSPDSTKIIYCSTDDLHPPLKNTSKIYTIGLKTRKVTTLIAGGTNTYASIPPMAKRSSSAKSPEPR